jgi:hypothetical protein
MFVKRYPWFSTSETYKDERCADNSIGVYLNVLGPQWDRNITQR